MNGRKKVLFVPTINYLSDPINQKIFPCLEGRADIYYITSSEPALLRADENRAIHPPQYVIPLSSEFKPARTSGKLLTDAINLHRYARPLLKQISSIKPDVIVLGSDQTPFIKMLDRNFPEIPKVVIQNTFINFLKGHKKRKQRHWLKNLIFRILDPVIYPLTYEAFMFGLANPDHHLFLFGEYSSNLYKGDKDKAKLHLTGYPMLERLILDSDESIVFILATGFTKEEEEEYYEDVVSLMHAFPDEKYILKKHPLSDPELFERFLNKVSHLNIKTAPVEKALPLKKYKGIVSFYSFGDIPFLFNGVPLICHRKTNLELFDFWYKDLHIPKSNTRTGFLDNFETIVKNKFNHEGISNYFENMFAQTGKASSETIANEIIKLSEGPRP